MIGLFDKDGNKLSITYRSLVLNNNADDPNDTYEVWAALIDAEHASVAEPKSQRDGSEIYRPKKQRRVIRISGAVKAPTTGELFDKIEALSAAFDPVNAYFADDATEDVGFLPMTFSRPTADTTNYSNGLKPLQFYARPLAIPVTRITKNDGKAAKFAVLMECADPRAYLQTSESVQRDDAGALAMDNTLASYMSWPTLTITLAGLSGVVKFERDSDHDTRNVRLDLSTCSAADEIVVDMELRTVTLNGDDAMDLVVSGFGDFWWMPPAEESTLNVVNVSGNSFDGTAEVSWRQAFV